MATPRQVEHQLDTHSGPVTVHVTVPGSADGAPMVLVPGVPQMEVGQRLGLRLARAGFAAACWAQHDPATTRAVVEAARAGALAAASLSSLTLLQLPGVAQDASLGIAAVAWAGPATDSTEPARLEESLDAVVRRLVAHLP